jgi:dephospho-CoA kinase
MIIAITGTIGAGKGVLVEYLKKKGFSHFSAREFIKKEIEKRGLTPDRDTMAAIANEIRKEHGATYIIESLYKDAVVANTDAVIESVREVAGAEFLKDEGAILIAVDADRRVRYERIKERGQSTDDVTFEKFVEQEERELLSADPYSQNILAVMEGADYLLMNNGTIKEFEEEIEALLASLE